MSVRFTFSDTTKIEMKFSKLFISSQTNRAVEKTGYGNCYCERLQLNLLTCIA